ELRGNVRILARARSAPGQTDNLSFGSDGPGLTLNGRPFEFDRVFSASSTQDDVFDEVAGVVQSAIDGHSVSVLAYGQTGSGKTYTVDLGKYGLQCGIIPRALELILQQTYVLTEDGRTHQMEVSALQVYNETIQDLLDSGGANLELRMASKISVQGLSSAQVRNIEDVQELLIRASKNRCTAKTAANAVSSRSHCVTKVSIAGSHASSEDRSDDLLHLVDLTGRERVARSSVTCDFMKEAQAMNTSPSALSGVFNAIDKGSKHVPYRDSKLTSLLQSCFSSGGKVQTVVNVVADARPRPRPCGCCILQIMSRNAPLGPKKLRHPIQA
ncbi:hypothetical protein PHYSODRAFT_525208, partial [Phytophthora sojae]